MSPQGTLASCPRGPARPASRGPQCVPAPRDTHMSSPDVVSHLLGTQVSCPLGILVLYPQETHPQGT